MAFISHVYLTLELYLTATASGFLYKGGIMASGKKNYFRHSFFARNDEFICEMIEQFGLQGYYYYFALIEMCGEQSEENLQHSYKFHKRTLVHSLRLNTRKLNLFLTYLQDKSKISCTLTGNQYEIKFPILSKYLGKYSSKNEPNRPNKRKGNKIKENKRKEKEIKENFSDENENKVSIVRVVELFNNTFKNQLPEVMQLSPTRRKKIKSLQKYLQCEDDWINYFNKILASDFLMGKNKDWIAKFDWIIVESNYLKVIEGNYENRTSNREFTDDELKELYF